MTTIYLDYNATTPVDDRVLSVMLPYFTKAFGNASSSHRVGANARSATERAREQVAETMGAAAGEVYFTSGATESINLAIKGIALGAVSRRAKIVTVATEHRAVLESCDATKAFGKLPVVVPVAPSGVVHLERLSAAIDEDTLLVSVMAANNETGVLQPITEIVEVAHANGAGLDGRDVQAAQTPGGMLEDVRVRVEDRHSAAIGKAGLFDEVAGAWTHIEVPIADVLAVTLDQSTRRAAPDEPGDEAEDKRVVQLEERPRVVALAPIGGIASVHRQWWS